MNIILSKERNAVFIEVSPSPILIKLGFRTTFHETEPFDQKEFGVSSVSTRRLVYIRGI